MEKSKLLFAKGAYSTDMVKKTANNVMSMVRKHLGVSPNKMTTYAQPGKSQEGKLYADTKSEKLAVVRATTDYTDAKQVLIASSQARAGNCGEYEVMVSLLLKLKGFSVATAVIPWGQGDNHAYTVLKFDGMLYTVDAWNYPEVKVGVQAPPLDPVGLAFSKQRWPLLVGWVDKDLYNEIALTAKSQGDRRVLALLTEFKETQQV